MARPGPATQAKRQREIAKQEKRKDKAERRAQRKAENLEAVPQDIAPGQDPDLLGMTPGPHNRPPA